jgi:hypothetical protein
MELCRKSASSAGYGGAEALLLLFFSLYCETLKAQLQRKIYILMFVFMEKDFLSFNY